MYGNHLDRVAAQVEMSPLMRTPSGLRLSREGKALLVSIRGKYADAVLATLDVEIARSIARRGMEYTANLIDEAAWRARGDEAKFMALLSIALCFKQVTERLMLRQIDPFGL